MAFFRFLLMVVSMIGVQSQSTVVCPPVALSLVLDGSGSIGTSAIGTCGGWPFPVWGNTAMRCFAKSDLDAVSSGPKGHLSQFAATEFDSHARELSRLTH